VCSNIILVKPEKASGHTFYAVLGGFPNFATEGTSYNGMQSFYVEKTREMVAV